MLKHSFQSLDVLVHTGNFIGVVYTLNRMDNIKQFILLPAQSLEQQHSHILGLIQHIKHQLFYIIIAEYYAKVFIMVEIFMYSAMYSK